MEAIQVVNLERQEHSHSDVAECRGGQNATMLHGSNRIDSSDTGRGSFNRRLGIRLLGIAHYVGNQAGSKEELLSRLDVVRGSSSVRVDSVHRFGVSPTENSLRIVRWIRAG